MSFYQLWHAVNDGFRKGLFPHLEHPSTRALGRSVQPWTLEGALTEVGAHLHAAKRASCLRARERALEKADLCLTLAESHLLERARAAIANMEIRGILCDD